MGPAALHTVYETFDPGYRVLFHLSPLQVSADKGTILTLDTACQQLITISQTKPNPIVIPPHPGNKDTSPTQHQQADTTQEDPSPLRPSET